MEKVLLVAPYFKKGLEGFPLGLAYVAGALKDKHNVSVLDLTAQATVTGRNPDEILKEKLKEYVPSVVGLTSTSPTHSNAIRTAKITRELLKEKVTIIKGGPHETNCAPITLRYHPEIDISVMGEGEETIIELLDYLSSGKSLQEVEGIAYRNGNDVKVTPKRKLIENLDLIQRPARELLVLNEELQRYYNSKIFGGKRTTSLLTTRGCPYDCSFCSSKTNWQNRLRVRTVENVLAEIEDLKEEGYEAFRLEDDMSIPSRKWFLKFAREIVRRGLGVEYSLQTRVNMINEEIVEALKESGGTFVYFGVESGVQDILDRCKKGINLDQIRNVFDLVRRKNIRSMATILFGLPGEKLDDFSTVRETIKFVNELNPSEGVAISYASLYPGSELSLSQGITAEEYEKTIKDFLDKSTRKEVAHGSHALHPPELTEERIQIIEEMLERELKVKRFKPEQLYSK